MIVDVNAYFGNWPYWPLRGGDIDSVLRSMDAAGIDRAFVSSLKGVFQDPAAGNAETLKHASAHPDRLSPAFTYSPYAAGFERYTDDLEQSHQRLVKLFPLNHSYDPLEEPGIAELCDFCAEKKVPVLIPYRLMMSWRLPVYSVPAVGNLAQRHVDTTFILGSINYLFELQSAMDLLRRFSNVFVETSAMMAYREIQKLVEEFGAARFLHGSGVPLQNPHIGPLKIRTAEIAEAEKVQIFSGNALHLFERTVCD